MDTNGQRAKGRSWKRILILVALPILIIAVLAALTSPFLPSGGWSKDVAVDNGMMDM